MSDQQEHKKKRTRSPNYPVFGLEQAIERVRTVYEGEDRHWAPPEAVAAHLKMSPTSSTFLTALGALRQFRLLDQKQGTGGNVRVTDLALDLLERERDSDTWATAAKTAALAPTLHAELWKKYGGALPPRDESIRIYLIREREGGQFNRNHVDSFIEQFRATLVFAGVTAYDKIPDETDQNTPSGTPGFPMLSPPQTPPNPPGGKPPPSDQGWSGPVVKLDLPRGNQVEIRLRSKVSHAEFQKLKKVFELSEMAFVEDDSATE